MTTPDALGALPLGDARIFAFQRNVVVAASAGTGKTHRLTGLYLMLVLGLTSMGQDAASAAPPLSPERIVATTFSRDAAQEMSRRIEAALRAAAGGTPGEPLPYAEVIAARQAALGVLVAEGELRERAALALRRWSSARIDTLHGWPRTSPSATPWRSGCRSTRVSSTRTRPEPLRAGRRRGARRGADRRGRAGRGGPRPHRHLRRRGRGAAGHGPALRPPRRGGRRASRAGARRPRRRGGAPRPPAAGGGARRGDGSSAVRELAGDAWRALSPWAAALDGGGALPPLPAEATEAVARSSASASRGAGRAPTATMRCSAS
ncbi:MAG: UvrD-helicase domain-containing protein [Polyangiaceae bacterium]